MTPRCILFDGWGALNHSSQGQTICLGKEQHYDMLMRRERQMMDEVIGENEAELPHR